MNAAGKIALITGGARRVGRALSLALARAGADVVVNYHRAAREAAETVREIAALDRRAIAVQADVSRSSEVDQLFERVRAELGRVDIVVNNAASFERKAFLDITDQEWDAVLGVNLKGPFLVIQRAAPLLRASGDGVIINIADLSAFQAWPSYAHHAVSKAGLVHLTRVAARALAPEIRVNCIAPGSVLPPVGAPAGEDGPAERRLTQPAGTPDDVARAMMFLVESNFVTGQVVLVDGGRSLL